MRKILVIATLASAIALAGCSGTTGGLPASSNPPPTVTGDATTDAIISGTVRACGFLPTVSTVTGIIASFISGGAPVNALVTGVAQSICNAVAPQTKKAARRGASRSGPPAVGGVVVEGQFVR